MPICISNDELAMLIEITDNKVSGLYSEIEKLTNSALCELQRARKKLKEYQDAKGME